MKLFRMVQEALNRTLFKLQLSGFLRSYIIIIALIIDHLFEGKIFKEVSIQIL